MTGIYIHIPFCLRKCPYCDFYSVRIDNGLLESYIDALCRNFRAEKYRGVKADTIYFGGGTPSVLTGGQVRRIIQGLYESFCIADDAEITIEANPCTVDRDKLLQYRQAGINRISFGVQSADDSELKALGRLHDYEGARRAVTLAQDVGFDNISCDIMLGTPEQNMVSLLYSAGKICELPIKHISAYMLKIEKGTAFDCEEVRKNTADDELVSDMYLSLTEHLNGRGFEQYEISNYARAGYESRHNLKYWLGQEYIGFGAAAHSLFDKKRYYVERDVQKYISAPLQEEIPEEEAYDERQEYIMLRVRLKSGLEKQRLKELYGDLAAEEMVRFCRTLETGGLCRVDEKKISLTPKGFLVSNSIIARLCDIAGLS